jgi:hypothetical protein
MDTDSDENSEHRNESSKSRPPIPNPLSTSSAAKPQTIIIPIPIRNKRPREDYTGPPPLKRARSDFNGAYLALLNKDIQEASSGLFYHGGDPKSKLEAHTQVGAVVWSAAEKEVFFEAVGHLGRHDSAGIAARVGTKGDVEVRQYLMLLDAAATKRRGEAKGHGLRPVDIPAAVEISAECGVALEHAADGLSLLQERYEEGVEKERWGSRWLITAQLAQILDNRFHSRQQQTETSSSRAQLQEEGQEEVKDEKERREEQLQLQEEDDDNDEDELPFLSFFRIRKWLELSDRVFMNSAISDGNWHAVSEEHEPPAIRATALADFHGLALSVTRRLVLATLYVAESRIRAKSLSHGIRRSRYRVRGEDVAAAVSSLGMKKDSMEFWARCARRLQLNVVDDRTEGDEFTDEEDEGSGDLNQEDRQSAAESSPKSAIDDAEEVGDEEDDYETMSHEQVEIALNCPTAGNVHERPSTPDFDVSSDSSLDISSTSGSDYNSGSDQVAEEGEDEEDTTMQDRPDSPTIKQEPEEDLDSDAIAQDIEEAVTYSAQAGQGVRARIRAEHRLERDAEQRDLKASRNAEMELWAVLRGDGDLKTKNSKAKGGKSRADYGEEGGPETIEDED